MSTAELLELTRRAQGGERDATSALLRQLYDVVRRQIYYQLGAGALADDAVQEAMIALHRGLPKFRGDASPRTWATTIAARIAQRMRRKERRHGGDGDGEVEIAIFDTDLAGAAEMVLLRNALETLAPKKRDAFVMMGILELTAEEAGRALGTFANTVASRFRHARAELEEHLARREKSLTTPAAGEPPRREG